MKVYKVRCMECGAVFTEVYPQGLQGSYSYSASTDPKPCFCYSQYKLLYEMKPIDSAGGKLYTAKEFKELVRRGLFTDCDGFGEYATRRHVSSEKVYPSDVESRNMNRYFSHVVWYNK